MELFFFYIPYYPYQNIYTYPMDYCSYCNPWVRMYYENIYRSMNRQLYKNYWNYVEENWRQSSVKEFTTEELAKYDGSGGNPAYVAINGIVYDVSKEGKWGGGTHFGLYAGKDLTAEFQGCHSKTSILRKLPKVGIIKV